MSNLRLRQRADLVTVPQQIGMTQRWAIKDPITLEYYHLGEQEFFLLQAVNDADSLDDIQEHFDATFAPQRITKPNLVAYLKQLHQSGLLLADEFGQSDVLLEKSAKLQVQKWQGHLLSPLAIRLRGIDASLVLDFLQPLARLLFHPLSFFALVIVWLSTIAFVIAQANLLVQRIPTAGDFFTGKNVVLLLVALFGVKLCHELGHGLACRHFGGECHEIGVMLLALMPCLYCDVSDAWMMPKRWHRVIVSAAGIYVELILSAACLYLWYFSVPGALNSLCLNIFLICSLSTIVFNGNPFLRYDGYFILADCVNTPNLFEQSRQAIWAPFRDWLAGTPQSRIPLDLGRGWLVIYGLLSSAYRLFVITSILSVMYHGLSSLKLSPLADTIVLITTLGMLAPVAKGLKRIVETHSHAAPIQWNRWLACLLLFLGLTAILFYIPVPRHVRATAIMQSLESESVYVPFSGQVTESLHPGTRVKKGQVVATLRNAQLEQDHVKAQNEIFRLGRELKTLRYQSNLNGVARTMVPSAAAALAAAENRLKTLSESLQRLQIQAPRDGIVFAAPYQDSPGDAKELPRWNRSPLDACNRNCFVDAGELLCLIGEPDEVEALAGIPSSDLPAVALGSEVRLRIAQLPGQTYRGYVKELSQGEVPRDDDQQVTSTDNERSQRKYFARIQLEAPVAGVRQGGSAFAKITTERLPLGIRLWNYIHRTFQFEL